jgi:hypothetical protein
MLKLAVVAVLSDGTQENLWVETTNFDFTNPMEMLRHFTAARDEMRTHRALIDETSRHLVMAIDNDEKCDDILKHLANVKPFAARIVTAFITHPASFGDSKVYAIFNDGTSREVFTYYNDELSFSESELVGLTAEEAQKLRTNKDIAYLRS